MLAGKSNENPVESCSIVSSGNFQKLLQEASMRNHGILAFHTFA